METKPLVSVIVPVHNAGDYLWNLLDSLVYQTLENIEIILVENSSTDNTLEIIEQFRQRFPEKIVSESIPPTNGPTPGRIYGMKMAKADYFYFCDADDIVEYHALQNLYQEAVEQECDLVYGPAWNIDPGREKRVMGLLPEDCPKAQFLYCQVPSFWTKLIHRSLIEKVGYPDDSYVFDDIAYVLTLCSYATKIGIIQTPVYYYFRRETSEVNSLFSIKSIDTIRAEKHALETFNPEYKESICLYLGNRMRSNIQMRWYFLDLLVKWLKELWPELTSYQSFQNNAGLYHFLEPYTRLPDTEIPKTLVISGFGGTDCSEWAAQMEETAFNLDRANIVCLSEESCEISAAPESVRRAAQRGDWEFVGHYFALRYLWEHGGIYLDTKLHFVSSLNLVLPFFSFFGFLDAEQFTDKIFGAQAGQRVIRSLLETYELDGYGTEPLSARLRNILMAEEGVRPNGRTNLFDYSCALFGPDVFLVQSREITAYNPPMHVCDYPFSEADGLELMAIPRSTLLQLCGGAAQTTNQRLANENARLKRRLNKIQHSRSWQITKPLRAVLRWYREH